MNEVCFECSNARIGCWEDCPLLQEYLEMKSYDESSLGVEELEN